MKTFIILICLLGCFSFAGYANHPIDPPKKEGKADKIVISPIPFVTNNAPEIIPCSPKPNDECKESRSVVDVTAVVTVQDCPDYDCSVPGPNCTCEICIYDNSSCSGTPLGCSDTWDPNTCTYYIYIQANENTSLYASFVCHNCSYGNGCIPGDILVPPGGGNVPFSDLRACPY